MEWLNQSMTANPFLRMVPFTIFQRLSSLGSGRGCDCELGASMFKTDIGCNGRFTQFRHMFPMLCDRK